MSIQPPEKHDHKLLKFPDGFLWGAATSAHQVEGGNINNNWWEWEQGKPLPLRSGQASDQYNLYEQDFNLAKELNHNSHRLSIEWSRIEPKMGEFNQSEIDHYIKVLKHLKSLNIKVMLTLWHFTLPLWVAEIGGWENGKTVKYFIRFLQKIVPEIAEYVDFWITLNEPGVFIYETYIKREWPDAKKSIFAQTKSFFNLASAHKKAYRFLHKNYPKIPVGIANNLQSFEPFHRHSITENLAVMWTDIINNHLFYFLTRGTHDFLGINYYFHVRIRDDERGMPQVVNATDESRDISDLGWEIFPEGIFDVLADVSDHKPIYITECGIASTNDDRRNRFLVTYLQEVYRAIESGIDVRGFFYWSLIDNFEWHRGFDPRFGLIEIDYATQKRIVRPSAKVYAEIIAENGIPHKLLRFIGHTVTAKEVLGKMSHQSAAFSSQTKKSHD